MKNRPLLQEQISALPPALPALSNGSQIMTYGELNWEADGLAVQLQALGVDKIATVAICLERSFRQIVAILAVMRAGAAYVPIDPAWPAERIRYIVRDSGAQVLIASTALSRRIASQVIALDPEDSGSFYTQPESPKVVSRTVSDDDLVYVIYTSGSTGVPKGVEITHANLEQLIYWHVQTFGIRASDRAAHLAGLGFDAAVWEIWPYLSVGASVALVDEMSRTDPALLQRWIVDQGVTVCFVPTPVAEPLVAMKWPPHSKLRTLLTGGDTLHSTPQAGLSFEFVNNYGPTECTVVATSGRIDAGGAGIPSIGRAIPGTNIYLLDEQKMPVPPHSVGEIYIGGTGVGRGYRNLPEETTKSFLPDPFSVLPGARMYKTGDRACLLPNGEIAFHGRLDNQEKIRGNRIELDEVASVLNRHPRIAFSVVVVSTNTAREKHMVAYVLLTEGVLMTAQEVREHASRWLPDYMIPSTYVQLSSLPLSPNGKVDRDLLPPPSERNTLSVAMFQEGSTEIESMILSLVRNLLHNEKIGLDDDFFMVGGHSLLGTQLVLRAREAFGVKLTLRDLFEASTVVRLAARIDALILDDINALTEEEALRLGSDGDA